MTALLDARNIRHSYGSLMTVDDVDLRVPPGGRHAIIGPNGAGKSTLLNIIAGLSRPHSGMILFNGRNITAQSPTARARMGIGRTHQQPAVFSSLTAVDNVVVAAWRVSPGFGPLIRPRLSRRSMIQPAMALLERLDIADYAKTPAGHLSHGQRRQLEIAMALSGEPSLLLLDEPGAGLSHSDLDRLIDLIPSVSDTVAILLVEHHRELVYSCADSITMLCSGRSVITGTPEEIRSYEFNRHSHFEAGPSC